MTKPKSFPTPPAPSPWQCRVMGGVIFGLVFTGLAQMPLFKRYYLADIPGFAWTADFYASHRIHYILAAVLLAWLMFRAMLTLGAIYRGWRPPLAFLFKGGIWMGIIFTGLARVIKNSPDFFFSPTTTMAIDWAHLLFMMLLAPAAWIARRSLASK